MLALALTVFSVRWVLAWLSAMAIHEGCHIAAVRLCAGKLYTVEMGAVGANISCEGLPAGKELICTAAGPIGSLLLALLYPCFPRIAICGLAQGLYNLLPLLPLDGGTALRQIVCGLWGNSERSYRVFQRILSGLLAVLAMCFLLFTEAGVFIGILLIPALCKNFLALRADKR